jgi:hypothetical protein
MKTYFLPTRKEESIHFYDKRPIKHTFTIGSKETSILLTIRSQYCTYHLPYEGTGKAYSFTIGGIKKALYTMCSKEKSILFTKHTLFTLVQGGKHNFYYRWQRENILLLYEPKSIHYLLHVGMTCGMLDGVVADGMTNPIHVNTFINNNLFRNQQLAISNSAWSIMRLYTTVAVLHWLGCTVAGVRLDSDFDWRICTVVSQWLSCQSTNQRSN